MTREVCEHGRLISDRPSEECMDCAQKKRVAEANRAYNTNQEEPMSERTWKGSRICLKQGWGGYPRTGIALEEPVYVDQEWLPVKWDDEEDPNFYKLAGLELSRPKEPMGLAKGFECGKIIPESALGRHDGFKCKYSKTQTGQEWGGLCPVHSIGANYTERFVEMIEEMPTIPNTGGHGIIREDLIRRVRHER